MTFEKIIQKLRGGELVRRECFDDNYIIFQQVPSDIGAEIIPKMQSLPSKAKDLILKYTDSILYRDQFLIYDFYTNIATYYVFDGDDIDATDWEVVDINTYNPYE